MVTVLLSLNDAVPWELIIYITLYRIYIPQSPLYTRLMKKSTFLIRRIQI